VSYIAIDTSGNTDICYFSVDVQSSINTNIVVTDVSSQGASDGALNLQLSGGSPPYSYLWSTGAITQDISGLPGGLYIVTVSDSSGCIVVDSAIVEEPAIACDRPNSVVGTHISGSDLTVCWSPGNPGSNVDKVQVQMRRKPNQIGCAFNVGNRIVNPTNAPNNCVTMPFNIANCDCIYQARARYRCIDGNFSPWKFDNNVPTSCAALRLTEESKFEPFHIYPNPVSDILSIDYVPWENGMIKITLFDILGKKQINKELDVEEGDNQLKVDVSQLSPGTYLLEIIEGDTRHTTKIVVAR
jgi:hypothetical protein